MVHGSSDHTACSGEHDIDGFVFVVVFVLLLAAVVGFAFVCLVGCSFFCFVLNNMRSSLCEVTSGGVIFIHIIFC